MANESVKTAHRIPDEQAVPIVILSAIFDLISLAPLVNVISVFVGQPIMFLIFTFMLGVPILGKKTWIWYAVTWVIEIIPFLSILPAFTLMTLRVIAISRAEDRAKSMGLKMNDEKTKAIARKFLQSKKITDLAKSAEKGTVANASRREDGTFDREKIREKRGQIAEKRSDLDKALAPGSKSRDINSGVQGQNKGYQGPQEQSGGGTPVEEPEE